MRVFVLAVLILFSADCFCQQDTTIYNVPIDPENFQPDLFNGYVLFKINSHRKKLGLDTLQPEQILINAADDHSKYMATGNELTPFQGGKKKTAAKRARFYGGSERAVELIAKTSLSKGRDVITYVQAANEFLVKWLTDEKTLKIITNPSYILCGIGTYPDADRKKIYISLMLSNYQLYNEGAVLRDQLTVPFTKKKKGLKPYDARVCKKCEKFRNIESLQEGLYVKDNMIYFKTDNLQQLKKVLKDPADGIVVDIVQPEQYQCDRENIVDFNRVNKGVMTKRMSIVKMLDKNLITDRKESKKKLEVMVAPLPKGITEPYEMNLMIVVDKHVCRNICKPFINEGGIVYVDALELLADTVIVGGSDYRPVAEESTLTFRIPFELNKSQYKKEDIDPFLKQLKEPEFIIKDISIAAYSSVEGNDQANKQLQQQRAESIVNALMARQKDNFISNITTGDNINDFNNDVKGTEFAHLAGKSVSEIQEYISKNNLKQKMEPILQKHRYAEITMNVKYEIEGKKEEQYVLSRFNKAVRDNDLVKALAIQKYIFKKVLNVEYTENAVLGQEIPDKPEYAGLLMNKLWLSGLLMNKLWLEKYLRNEDLNEDYCERIGALYQMAPENHYIKFNHLYCRILSETFNTDAKITEMQRQISSLYATPLKRGTVDRLNIEYQVKVISTIDTLDEPSPMLLACLDTIRSLTGARESNWQNALKLANIFMKQGDYEFALKMIDPFVGNKHVFEELLFTYIGLCTYTANRIYTNNFALAFERAMKTNSDRLCKMIKKRQLTIQVLENPKVKKIYCESCK